MKNHRSGMSTRGYGKFILAFTALLGIGCSKAKPQLTALNAALLNSSSSGPTVTIKAKQGSPTHTNLLNLVQFTVTFSEAIDPASFTTADLSLDASSTISAVNAWSLAPDDATYTVFTIEPTNTSGDGTIIPKVVPSAINTASGKAFSTLAYGAANGVWFDLTIPAMTLTRDPGQSTSVSSFPILFKMHFDEAVTLDAVPNTFVTNAGTLTGVTWQVTDSGNSKDFVISAISAGGLSGTVYPSVAALIATDGVGYQSTATTAGAGEAVTYTSGAMPPSAPTSITLTTPATSPGNTAAPIFTVGGLTAGDDVRIYSDASCSTAVSGFVTATGATQAVTAGLGADGAYTIYAKASNVNGSSSCSGVSASYTLDTVAPSAPTGIALTTPASSPGASATPIFTVSGVSTGLIVKLYSGSGCQTFHSSGAAAGSTKALTASTLTAGTYNFYANATDAAGNVSSCVATPANYIYIDNPASLTISDGALYNYGSVANGSSADKTFTITNSGNYGASSMGAAAFASDFNFKGGSYPGTGGTCGTTLAIGGTCTIVVTFSPTNGGGTIFSDVVTINYNNGFAASQAARAVTGTGTGLVAVSVTAVYSGFSNWNQYVKGGLVNCTGSETGYYGDIVNNGCVHAGLAKKVTVTGQASCTGLTITDSLGVFDWYCDLVSGVATFFLKDFKEGYGLKDLINSGGPSWKTLSVTVYLNATAVAQSTAAAWWSDSFTLFTGNASPVFATPSNTIYYTIADTTIEKWAVVNNAYPFALVNLNGSKINFNGAGIGNSSGGCAAGSTFNEVLCMSGAKFMWIEADINGNFGTYKATSLISFESVKYSRIHNTVLHDNNLTQAYIRKALYLDTSNYNMLSDVRFYNITGGVTLSSSNSNILKKIAVAHVNTSANTSIYGVSLDGSSSNYLDFVKISDVRNGTANNAIGVWVQNSSNSNIFSNVSVANIETVGAGLPEGLIVADSNSNIFSVLNLTATEDAGIYLANASNNIFSHVTAANNGFNGLYGVTGPLSNNTFNSFISVNSGVSNGGIEFDSGVTSGTGNRLINSGSMNNGYSIKIIDGGLSGFLDISGYLFVNPAVCSIASGANATASCSTNNAGFTRQLLNNGIVGSAFPAWIATDDATNPRPSQNESLSNLNSLMDWLVFDNFFRTWGKYYNSAFPSSNHLGVCSGTCNIWDWRVSTNGQFHNRSFDGSTTNSFSPTGTCSGAMDGSSKIITTSSPALTFMQFALEASWGKDINRGNGNGLCESNEDCVYAGNIGAYQGEGNPLLSNAYCTTAGTITGAKIYTYPTTSF